jgi:CRP-like cAMP-binding protein
MNGLYSFFQGLSSAEVSEIKSKSVLKKYNKGDLVFAEGDNVDYFYIIESGGISIYVDKCGTDEPICRLAKHDYFGEMAIFNKDRRTASAMACENTVLFGIDKDRFLQFIKRFPQLAVKFKTVLAKRNEELLLIESLMLSTGINGKKLQISIKGDPSIRESAFFRRRYESVVDKLLPELEPVLEDLLLNRCIYKLFLNFNSGEVRTRSVFNPFNEKIHTVNKLINKAYVDRHFLKISYLEKSQFIKRLFGFVSTDTLFSQLPGFMKNTFIKLNENWQPVEQKNISIVMKQLRVLRNIKSFYLRNLSISIIQDTIRLQFNCDGTHFLSSEDYSQFLQENLSATE